MIINNNTLTFMVRRQLLLITLAILTIMGTSWFFLLDHQIKHSEQHRVSAHARLLASAIRPAVLFHDRAMARRLLASVIHDQSGGVIAIAVYDRHHLLLQQGQAVDWPSDIMRTDGSHDTLRNDRFFAAAPIMMQQRRIGTLALASRSSLYHNAMEATRNALLVAILAAVGLTVALAAPLHRRVTSPLSRLVAILRDSSSKTHPESLQPTIDALSALARQTPAGTPEEIRLLIDSQLQQMTQIAAQWEQLQRFNQQLESQVEERTKDYLHARQKAERLAESRSRFLATMSHEIRTPMNAIIGLVRLALNDKAALPASTIDQLHTVMHASNQMRLIVDEILDFSKIDAGAMAISPHPFDLEAIANEIGALFRPMAEEKGLDFTITCPNELPPLQGDSQRICQIMRNLISNAVKFTDEGEVRVALSLRTTSARRVLLRASVADSGIGISAEDQQRLFTPFMQADSGDQRRFGGTGLGLAISRQLAELMGGELTVSSRVGEGTTFQLTLPLHWADRDAPAATDATLTADTLQPLRGKQVLLVEDEPINRKLMLALLRRVAIDVTVAEDGQEAVAVAPTRPFDAILMDMQMPRMGGVEATRRIRRLAACRATPIIAITANVMQDDRQACLDAGMNDLLTKPVDDHKLYAALLRWITGRAPAPSAAPPTQQEPSPLFDAERMRARLGNDQTLQREVLRDFLHHHRHSGDRLRKMVQQGEREAAHRLAHNLAGLAGTLTAESLASSARQLMTALREPDRDCDLLLHQCCYQLQRLIHDIDHYLNGTGAPAP